MKNTSGEVITDLTTPSVRYVNNNPDIIDEFYVGDDMVMRTDLVSKIAYGTTDFFDLLMKFNAISNPYSLDVGEYILVPDLVFMLDSLVNPQNNDESIEVREQYYDKNKKSEIDSKKIEHEQKLKKSNREAKYSKYSLPPNLAQPGSSEGKVLPNGKILLGGDVTKNTTDK